MVGTTNAQREMIAPEVVARLSAYNYLDNSNFEEFIAQAGVGGKHGNQAYAGDRWILVSGTASGTANANGNGYRNITLNGTIRQIVSNPPAAGTPVINMVSGTATISYANGEVTITSSGGVIKSIGLYEGEYSAGCTPKYQPKGYGTELAECQRYYYQANIRTIGVAIAEDKLNIHFPFAVTVRVNPTVTINSCQYYDTVVWEAVELVGSTQTTKATKDYLSVEFQVSVSAFTKNSAYNITQFSFSVRADL